MFSTAEGLLTQEDQITADGLQEVFETNVFGHFILVKRLEAHSAHISVATLKAHMAAAQGSLFSSQIPGWH